MFRTSLTMLLIALALAGGTAHAQRARCTDANGMGYECGGSMGRSAPQSVQHSGMSQNRQPQGKYMDAHERSQYTGSNLSQSHSSSSANISPVFPAQPQRAPAATWPSTWQQHSAPARQP